MTKLTDPQVKNKHTMVSTKNPSNEEEQILYLKRLIVTLKQQYEKNLHELNEELHVEQLRNQALQKELDSTQSQVTELNVQHREELRSLKEQLLSLRDLLKKAQEDQKTALHENENQSNGSVNIEVEMLKQKIERKQKRIVDLEAKLENQRAEADKELNQLKNSLSFFEEQDVKQELITSTTSSYQLRQDLELIKQTLVEGMQETKSLESRYANLFHEKMDAEHQCKLMQAEYENQKLLSESLQAKTDELVLRNKSLETALHEKDAHLMNAFKNESELKEEMKKWEAKCRALDVLQEKYEELKEEHIHLSRNLEETIQLRLEAETQLEKIDCLSREQAQQFSDKCQESNLLIQERAHLQADIEHLHELLSDSESRLKVAQQHLAKKVKESALLMERVEEQQNSISDYLQFIDTAKAQINQMQNSIEHYQKQEQKLQEQLHEALKGTESQVAKWEKKYFEMYDKWQESENQIRELRKFEEKHLQMQNLLSNLGNFMGSSISPSQLFNVMQDSKMNRMADSTVQEELTQTMSEEVNENEVEPKYDLFGIPQVSEKLNSN